MVKPSSWACSSSSWAGSRRPWCGALAARLLPARPPGWTSVVDRLGLKAYLERHDIHGRVSSGIGWVLYGAILFSALVLAFGPHGPGSQPPGFLRTPCRARSPRFSWSSSCCCWALFWESWPAPCIHRRSARLLGLPAPEIFGSGARVAVFLLAPRGGPGLPRVGLHAGAARGGWRFSSWAGWEAASSSPYRARKVTEKPSHPQLSHSHLPARRPYPRRQRPKGVILKIDPTPSTPASRRGRRGDFSPIANSTTAGWRSLRGVD